MKNIRKYNKKDFYSMKVLENLPLLSNPYSWDLNSLYRLSSSKLLKDLILNQIPGLPMVPNNILHS